MLGSSSRSLEVDDAEHVASAADDHAVVFRHEDVLQHGAHLRLADETHQELAGREGLGGGVVRRGVDDGAGEEDVGGADRADGAGVDVDVGVDEERAVRDLELVVRDARWRRRSRVMLPLKLAPVSCDGTTVRKTGRTRRVMCAALRR